MAESNNIRKRSEEIQLNIASDNIQPAIILLLDFVKDFSDDKSDKDEVSFWAQNILALKKLNAVVFLPTNKLTSKEIKYYIKS